MHQLIAIYFFATGRITCICIHQDQETRFDSIFEFDIKRKRRERAWPDKSDMAWRASIPWLGILAISTLVPMSRSDLSIRVRPGIAASSSTPSTAENVIVDNGGVNSDINDVMSVYSQSIAGNSSTETVHIDYVAADGATVTSLTDFRMQSQVVRVIVPGEEELGQPRFQVR